MRPRHTLLEDPFMGTPLGMDDAAWKSYADAFEQSQREAGGDPLDLLGLERIFSGRTQGSR